MAVVITPEPSLTSEPTAVPTKTPVATTVPEAVSTAAPAESPSGSPVSGPSDTTGDKDNNSTDSKDSKPVKAGQKITISGLRYKVVSIDAKIVRFTGAKKNIKKVIIPASIKIKNEKYKVIAIAKGALKGQKKLKKLIIGANIRSIGKNAFKGCKNLKKITIKTKKLSSKNIGGNAFKGINNKAIVKVPKGNVKLYKKLIKAKSTSKSIKVKN